MFIQPSAFRHIASQYLVDNYTQADQQICDRVYKAHFKLCPLGTAKLWFKLSECNALAEFTPPGSDVKIPFSTCQPVHLLWTLHYMKNYVSEDVCALLFRVSNKTHRKYFWAIVHFLNLLATETVSK